MTTTASVYIAGGGSGRRNITFTALAEGQSEMFGRTLNKLSDFQIEHLAQEKRQTSVVDIPVTITVNIAREDFPDVSARIEITYIPSASQQAWNKFVKDTCKSLKIDFIQLILDRVDKSPVYRILRLRNNGDYLARQRETSAILEVINTGRTPMEVSWDITMEINNVKKNLDLDGRNQPVIDRRVASLVSKPLTREAQRDIATLVLNAVSPKVAVGIMEQFHRQYKVGPGQTEEDPQAEVGKEGDSVDWGDVAKYDNTVDIISLHRICMETLGRFATKGRAKNIASGPCFEYVCGVIDGLRHEVDVVVLGLKLLSDVMKYLVEERERTYHVILNCIQAYAPPAPKHRPRNPKRLRPAEDLYQESVAALGGAGFGFGTGVGPVTSPGGVSSSNGASGLSPLRVGPQQAPKVGAMPDMHPSLRRYGDFYGHSPAPPAGSALEYAQSINLTKLYDSKHTDASSRWRTERASPRKDPVRETVAAAPTGVSDTTRQRSDPPDPDSVKALVRGRVRIDHQAAAHALQSAFSGTGGPPAKSASVPVIGSSPSTEKAGAQAGNAAGTATGETAEFVELHVAFKETQKLGRKYQYKVKDRSAKGGGGQSSDGEDVPKKPTWKGTVGAIGRKVPEKPKEVVIDFKKKIEYDPGAQPRPILADNGPHGADTATAVGTDCSAAGPTLERGAATVEEGGEADLADKAAFAEAMRAASAAGKRKKKRHHKLTIAPLPLVPCVVFRGLSGKSKQNLAVMQSFATLYKMVSQNYGNRDVAFKLGVAEEVSAVATVCQGMPRALDYYIWIVDALYRDGFGELTADELDVALEDYTMVLSASVGNAGPTRTRSPAPARGVNEHPAAGGGGGGGGGGDAISAAGSMTGFVFETVSEMTVPSIDQDGLLSEATPVVSVGTAVLDDLAMGAPGIKTEKRRRRSSTAGDSGVEAAEGSAGHEAAPPEAAGLIGVGSKVGTEDAVNDNPIVPSNQIKKAANQLLVNALGLFEFEARYVQRPADDIVIAVAMVAAHIELESRERGMAQRWLDTWDDNSRDFKALRRKGADLAGL